MPETVVVSWRCRRLNSIKCLRRKVQKKKSKENPPPNLKTAPKTQPSVTHLLILLSIFRLPLSVCIKE